MKKVNTSVVSGTEERLPAEEALFQTVLSKIRNVYRSHGFQTVETPIMERTSILLAKAGGDTEKQIYKLVKTNESAEESTEALRFDHTVPLARYVVEHENDLVFPFKVSQIGPSFRGERAQKGRFREFFQADVDVIGRNGLDWAYDAEVIATLFEALDSLRLPGIVARVSHRAIWNGLLKEMGIFDKMGEILSIIDHSEKVSEEKTLESFKEAGLTPDEITKITSVMSIHGTADVAEKRLAEIACEEEEFTAGCQELIKVLRTLESQNVSAEADFKIVRGLDYYTGTVFEFNLRDYKSVGSVAGGGRYANLASYFTEENLPGVGGSIGVSRLYFAMKENKLISDELIPEPLVDYVVLPLSDAEYNYSVSVAAKLRTIGCSADVVFSKKRVGDLLSYASKFAKYAVVIGGDEVKSGEVIAKDLKTGEKLPLNLGA